MNDQRPLHEQAAGAIRGAVVAGEVEPGDRLPPARDLASALGINANTVLRALRQLRDEGMLEFRRGRGVSVLRTPQARTALRERAQQLLDEAKQYGYGAEDLVTWIREAP